MKFSSGVFAAFTFAAFLSFAHAGQWELNDVTYVLPLPTALNSGSALANFMPESATLEMSVATDDAPAPVPSPTSPPSAGIEGQVGISPWFQKLADKPNEFNLKGRIRIDGWVNLTEDGCLKLRARLTTGEKFNNEWINSGVGTADPDFRIALRQVYVSLACLKGIQIEAGSVPVKNFGNLGLSDNGSIDGVQVSIIDAEHQREWLLSAGHVGIEADLFKRNLTAINHGNIQVRQSFGKEISAYLSVSNYESTFYSRTGIQWILSQYSAWLKDVGADIIFADEKYRGVAGYTRFNVGPWNSRIALSTNIKHPTEGERLALLMKQFYGYGKNIYLETSRDYSKTLSVNARIRLGDAGPMALAGVTWKFRAAKRARKLPQ